MFVSVAKPKIKKKKRKHTISKQTDSATSASFGPIKNVRRRTFKETTSSKVHPEVNRLAKHMYENGITFNDTSKHMNHELCSPENNDYFDVGQWYWKHQDAGAEVLVVPGITNKKDFKIGFNAFELNQLENVVNCIASKGIDSGASFNTARR